MMSGSVARRYARAILLIGQQHGNYDLLAAEIDRLASVYSQSADLRALLENPAFTLAQRQTVFETVSRKMGLSTTCHSLAMMLLERGRTNQLPGIARNLRTLVDEQAGRVRAKVTSATPLDAGAEVRIRHAIGKATGKSVILEKHEDPSLIGGVVTQVGDVIYDGSLVAELTQLRARWAQG